MKAYFQMTESFRVRVNIIKRLKNKTLMFIKRDV